MPKTTLADYLAKTVAHDRFPGLAGVLGAIGAACVEISTLIRTAPISGLSGVTGTTNVQGEDQKPLDIASNDVFLRQLGTVPAVSCAASEELDNEVVLNQTGPYSVFFDPLDGSSNLDVNVTVGSIFSIIEATNPGDLLQPGTRQIAAGFAAYGPATTLILTLGASVAMFALDGETFVLINADLKVPDGNREFAINSSRERYWDDSVRHYISDRVSGADGKYNMRWVGSMVAEIQRILTRGGIFLYPADSETRSKGGRLRLMYEANPMAMIIETAGGGSSEGTHSILDIPPTGLHQRVPVILGSADEVAKFNAYTSGANA